MSYSSKGQPLEQQPTPTPRNPHASTAGAPRQETVDIDWPCVHCDYNLRTLSIAGNCPECGRPVANTVENSLVYADLAWLRDMRSGTALLGRICIAGFVCLAFDAVLAAAETPGVAAILLPLEAIILGLLYAVYPIILTGREPNPTGPTPGPAVRAGATVTLFATPVGLVLCIGGSSGWFIVPGLLLAWAGLLAPWIVAPIVVRMLPRRYGDEHLANHAGATLLAVLVVTVITLLAAFTEALIVLTDGGDTLTAQCLRGVLWPVSVLTHVLALALGVWLMFRAARMLGRVIVIAERLREAGAEEPQA